MVEDEYIWGRGAGFDGMTNDHGSITKPTTSTTRGSLPPARLKQNHKDHKCQDSPRCIKMASVA